MWRKVFPPNEAKTLSHQAQVQCCFTYFIFVYFQAKTTRLCLVKGTDQEVSLGHEGLGLSDPPRSLCLKYRKSKGLVREPDRHKGTRADTERLHLCKILEVSFYFHLRAYFLSYIIFLTSAPAVIYLHGFLCECKNKISHTEFVQNVKMKLLNVVLPHCSHRPPARFLRTEKWTKTLLIEICQTRSFSIPALILVVFFTRLSEPKQKLRWFLLTDSAWCWRS